MTMTEERKILAVLSREEKNDFLPGQLWQTVSSLPGFKWLKTPLPDEAAWEQELLSFQPEIIMGCWDIPALPASLRGKLALRYYCNLGGGVRKIPIEYLDDGLLVTNWGKVISPTIAESALLLILMCLRRATHWTLKMHVERTWKDGLLSYNESLIGKRVGLHGLGASSRALVPMLKPFTTHLAAYSPSVPATLFAELGVRRAASLEELFSGSDVLVELAAATPKNYHIVDEKLLRMLPEGATFVNVGRGNVVDEAALARIAGEGRLQVGLDVYEKEPLPGDSPFRGLSNVNLFPHMGGPTVDRRQDAGRAAVDNLLKYLAGQPLDFVVTREIYERST